MSRVRENPAAIACLSKTVVSDPAHLPYLIQRVGRDRNLAQYSDGSSMILSWELGASPARRHRFDMHVLAGSPVASGQNAPHTFCGRFVDGKHWAQTTSMHDRIWRNSVKNRV